MEHRGRSRSRKDTTAPSSSLKYHSSGHNGGSTDNREHTLRHSRSSRSVDSSSGDKLKDHQGRTSDARNYRSASSHNHNHHDSSYDKSQAKSPDHRHQERGHREESHRKHRSSSRTPIQARNPDHEPIKGGNGVKTRNPSRTRRVIVGAYNHVIEELKPEVKITTSLGSWKYKPKPHDLRVNDPAPWLPRYRAGLGASAFIGEERQRARHQSRHRGESTHEHSKHSKQSRSKARSQSRTRSNSHHSEGAATGARSSTLQGSFPSDSGGRDNRYQSQSHHPTSTSSTSKHGSVKSSSSSHRHKSPPQAAEPTVPRVAAVHADSPCRSTLGGGAIAIDASIAHLEPVRPHVGKPRVLDMGLAPAQPSRDEIRQQQSSPSMPSEVANSSSSSSNVSTTRELRTPSLSSVTSASTIRLPDDGRQHSHSSLSEDLSRLGLAGPSKSNTSHTSRRSDASAHSASGTSKHSESTRSRLSSRSGTRASSQTGISSVHELPSKQDPDWLDRLHSR